MEYVEKIKKMLCKELDEYAMKNKLTMNDLQPVHLMTDIIKNLDKIEMLEGESEGYSEARSGRGRSSDDDMMYSERRGRGRNAKRDSMGRYSSEGGSYDDYSEESSSYARGGQGGRGYSKDEAKDHLMRRLGSMMEDASPNERETLKMAMREIEKAD